MYSKLLTLLIVYLSVVTANDIRLGYATPSSRKIYSEIKELNPALWTRTDDVIINAPHNEIIDAIYITDLRPDKDGNAYVESGGIGMKSATIRLESPSVLRGYKFEIEVYAANLNGLYQNKGYSNQYNIETQYGRKF